MIYKIPIIQHKNDMLKKSIRDITRYILHNVAMGETIPIRSGNGDIDKVNKNWMLGVIKSRSLNKTHDSLVSVIYGTKTRTDGKSNLRNNDTVPLILDAETNLKVKSIRVPKLITLDITVMFKSESKRNNVVEALELLAFDGRYSYLHQLENVYSLHPYILNLIGEVRGYREEILGVTETPTEYLSRVGDERLTLLSDISGVGGIDIGFKETISNLVGVYTSDIMNPDVGYDDKTGYHTCNFTYEYTMEMTTSSLVEHDIVMYNKLLPGRYIYKYKVEDRVGVPKTLSQEALSIYVDGMNDISTSSISSNLYASMKDYTIFIDGIVIAILEEMSYTTILGNIIDQVSYIDQVVIEVKSALMNSNSYVGVHSYTVYADRVKTLVMDNLLNNPVYVGTVDYSTCVYNVGTIVRDKIMGNEPLLDLTNYSVLSSDLVTVMIDSIRNNRSYLHIPSFDTHTEVTDDTGWTPVFSVLVTVSNDDKKSLFNLSALGEFALNDTIQNFIRHGEWEYINQYINSIFKLSLFDSYGNVMNYAIVVDSELNVSTVSDLSINGAYRVLFSTIDDLSRLLPEAQDRTKELYSDLNILVNPFKNNDMTYTAYDNIPVFLGVATKTNTNDPWTLTWNSYVSTKFLKR